MFWPILYYSVHNIVYIIYSVHNTVYIIYSAHNDGNVLDKTLLVVRFGFGLAASRVLVSQTCCGVFPRLSFLIFGHSYWLTLRVKVALVRTLEVMSTFTRLL